MDALSIVGLICGGFVVGFVLGRGTNRRPAPAAALKAPPAPDELAKIKAVRDSGQMITAIKMYRDQTGAGLKQAKEAVEQIV